MVRGRPAIFRDKPKHVTFRLTQHAYDFMEERRQSSGYTRSDFLVWALAEVERLNLTPPPQEKI